MSNALIIMCVSVSRSTASVIPEMIEASDKRLLSGQNERQSGTERLLRSLVLDGFEPLSEKRFLGSGFARF